MPSAECAGACILPAGRAIVRKDQAASAAIPHYRGRAAVLAAAVAFGVYGILSKFALNAGVEPLVLLFWRFGLAALLLLLLARIVKEPPLNRSSLPALAALGVLYAAMSLTYILTVKNAGVPYAVLLLYAYPAVVAAIERVHGAHLHVPRLIATAMALAGVALLVYAPHGSISAAGALIGLCSALAYGLYIYYGSATMREAPAIGGAAAIVTAAADLRHGASRCAAGRRYAKDRARKSGAARDAGTADRRGLGCDRAGRAVAPRSIPRRTARRNRRDAVA